MAGNPCGIHGESSSSALGFDDDGAKDMCFITDEADDIEYMFGFIFIEAYCRIAPAEYPQEA